MHNTNAKKKIVNQKSQQKYFAQNKFIFKYEHPKFMIIIFEMNQIENVR